MATFTRAELESKTSKALKRMCVDELGIVGMTKKDKATVVNAILAKYGESAAESQAEALSKEMSGIEYKAQSTITKPEAPFGHRNTTTIHVSCGASSGNFPVVGRTVQEVGEFLREVLNVDKLSTGIVNGKNVDADYVLKEGDALEFLKPAGKKGC